MTGGAGDAADRPYAMDTGRVWHQRVWGDQWSPAAGTPQCRTMCGRAVHSQFTSATRPSPGDCGGTLCPCVDAAPGVTGTVFMERRSDG